MNAAILPDSYQPEPVLGGRHVFVAIEGISGSGKSTVTQLVAKELTAYDLHILPPAFQQRTPGVNAALASLPQLAFYLSGLLHASDLIRDQLPGANVVTDRYAGSVIANHAAVHNLDMAAVEAQAASVLQYLARPALTAFLAVGPKALAARIARKRDLTQSDRALFRDPELLARVAANYAALAARDPSALVIYTDGLSPDDVAARIVAQVRDRGHGA